MGVAPVGGSVGTDDLEPSGVGRRGVVAAGMYPIATAEVPPRPGAGVGVSVNPYRFRAGMVFTQCPVGVEPEVPGLNA